MLSQFDTHVRSSANFMCNPFQKINFFLEIGTGGSCEMLGVVLLYLILDFSLFLLRHSRFRWFHFAKLWIFVFATLKISARHLEKLEMIN